MITHLPHKCKLSISIIFWISWKLLVAQHSLKLQKFADLPEDSIHLMSTQTIDRFIEKGQTMAFTKVPLTYDSLFFKIRVFPGGGIEYVDSSSLFSNRLLKFYSNWLHNLNGKLLFENSDYVYDLSIIHHGNDLFMPDTTWKRPPIAGLNSEWLKEKEDSLPDYYIQDLVYSDLLFTLYEVLEKSNFLTRIHGRLYFLKGSPSHFTFYLSDPKKEANDLFLEALFRTFRQTQYFEEGVEYGNFYYNINFQNLVNFATEDEYDELFVKQKIKQKSFDELIRFIVLKTLTRPSKNLAKNFWKSINDTLKMPVTKTVYRNHVFDLHQFSINDENPLWKNRHKYRLGNFTPLLYPIWPGDIRQATGAFSKEQFQRSLRSHLFIYLREVLDDLQNEKEYRLSYQFLIQKDGIIRDIEITGGINTVIDRKVMEALKSIPLLQPATVLEEPVAMPYSSTLIFTKQQPTDN